MMSYIDLNWDFSQFDRDNSARFHVRNGAARAGVPIRVRQPSTWTVLPPAPGKSGSRIRPSLIDLSHRADARRMR